MEKTRKDFLEAKEAFLKRLKPLESVVFTHRKRMNEELIKLKSELGSQNKKVAELSARRLMLEVSGGNTKEIEKIKKLEEKELQSIELLRGRIVSTELFVEDAMNTEYGVLCRDALNSEEGRHYMQCYIELNKKLSERIEDISREIKAISMAYCQEQLEIKRERQNLSCHLDIKQILEFCVTTCGLDNDKNSSPFEQALRILEDGEEVNIDDLQEEISIDDTETESRSSIFSRFFSRN